MNFNVTDVPGPQAIGMPVALIQRHDPLPPTDVPSYRNHSSRDSGFPSYSAGRVILQRLSELANSLPADPWLALRLDGSLMPPGLQKTLLRYFLYCHENSGNCTGGEIFTVEIRLAIFRAAHYKNLIA